MSRTQTVEYELESLASPSSSRVNDHETVQQPPAASVYPSGTKLVMLTIGLVLSIFLSALDSTIIATAIPSITDELGSIADIAWYGTAYAITNTAFQSAWGKAYQQFSLKPTLLAAIAVFEVGNIICATSASSADLILGRVVAGVGGGGIMTGAFIIIALTSPPRYRAAYMAILGVTFGTASVAGPLLGGALTDGPGWRFCFWISLPIGVITVMIMTIFLAQPVHTPPPQAKLSTKIRNMDLNGALLVTTSLTCFVMAMHWGGTIYRWSSVQVVMSLAASIVAALIFAANEWLMGSKAMLPKHLFRNKIVVLNLVFINLLAGLYFPLLYTLPIQFQAINNQSAAQSGVRLIPLVLGISVFTMVSNGALTLYQGYYNPFMVAGSVLGAIGSGMIVSLGSKASTASWIGYEVLTASGIGLGLQIPMLANQAAVSAADMAVVTSVTLFFENVGTTIFVAASEAAFTNSLVKGVKSYVKDVAPQVIIDAGATQLRQRFDPEHLPGILHAYLQACKTSHLVGLICGCAAVGVALINAGPAVLKRVNKPLNRAN